MLEMLKKLGLPATVAAVVAALVTIIPFLFKIDERYAKADELNARIVTVSKQINDLSIEVGRLAGTQQVLVAVISANKMESRQQVQPRVRLGVAASVAPTVYPTYSTGAPVLPAPVAPKNAEEKKSQLDQVSKVLEHTQSQVRMIQSK